MRFPPREGPRFRFGGPGPFVVREHPAIKMLREQALWSVADWEALRAFAEQHQAESILR